jgi:hypothetical protein
MTSIDSCDVYRSDMAGRQNQTAQSDHARPLLSENVLTAGRVIVYTLILSINNHSSFGYVDYPQEMI